MSSEFDNQNDASSVASFNPNTPSLGWFAYVTSYFTSLYKTCYRFYSGKTEIERILHQLQTTSIQHQANLSFLLLKSLSASKNISLNNISEFLDGNADTDLSHEKAVDTIIRTKIKGKPTKTVSLKPTLEQTLFQISNFGEFKNKILEKQQERYNSDCVEHEQLLRELWKHAGIGEFERKSNNWQDLGFQGDDPASDFRGSGVLSLWCMVRYVKENPEESRSFINKSRHPQTGYSWALVVINATQLLIELINSGNINLRKFLYKIDREDLRRKDASLDLFGDILNKIVYDLVELWDIKEEKDVMRFAEVRKKYKKMLEKDNPNFPTVQI